MDINLIVKISARAWSLPILAALHRGVPGRQAALLSATRANRTAFGQSLKHLIELGMLERNPGHGHPLRPEYRLTPDGIKAAAMADQIETASPQTAQNTLLRRAWTLPILAVSARPIFFSEIKGRLPTITDRALSQSLKNLQGENWLERHLNPDIHPPRAQYMAANDGALISLAVGLPPHSHLNAHR